MRPHVTFHQTLRPAFGYPQQSRKKKKLRRENREPEFIGGTVPWLDPRRTCDLMRGMPGTEDASGKILHITLSLPKGMHLGREDWSKIVRQTLRELGLPETGVPWLCFRHRDAGCDHVHITAIAVTFDGRRIALSDLDQRCTAAHIANCLSLGLEPPPYLRPGAGPRHDIFLPARRQTSAERKTIAASIHRVLRHRQPTSPDAFITALAEDGWGISARQNANGSWFFHLNGQEVAGEWLSPELAAWPMARRFKLASQLCALRGLIAERRVEQAITKVLFDAAELTKGQPDARRSSLGHDLGGRPAEAAGVAGAADPETERGVQALQPLIELLVQPEGQSSDAISRLAELLSATLARQDRIGDELAATNSALTTLVSRQTSLEEQITVQGKLLKELHEALVDD